MEFIARIADEVLDSLHLALAIAVAVVHLLVYADHLVREADIVEVDLV